MPTVNHHQCEHRWFFSKILRNRQQDITHALDWMVQRVLEVTPWAGGFMQGLKEASHKKRDLFNRFWGLTRNWPDWCVFLFWGGGWVCKDSLLEMRHFASDTKSPERRQSSQNFRCVIPWSWDLIFCCFFSPKSARKKCNLMIFGNHPP